MGSSKKTLQEGHTNGGIANAAYKQDEGKGEEVTKAESETSEGKRERRTEDSEGRIYREHKPWAEEVREEKREEKEEEKEEELPDGGWGWVVTFGCVIIAVFFFLSIS